MRLLIFLLLIILLPFPSRGQDEQAQTHPYEHLNILCIGNSFSMDATLCLPQLLVDMGVPNSKLCVYCAMYAGASLDYWWDHCSQGDTIKYLYRMSAIKLEDRTWTINELLHQPWDVVILQQASVYSDQLDTYRPYLKDMVEMVRRESANPDVTIAFQMTWSKHPTARTGPYGLEGWRGIAKTVRQMCEEVGITTIIPTGTILQNMRSTQLNTPLLITRDAFHLAYGIGQYAAALSFYESICRPITGKSALGIPPSAAMRAIHAKDEGFIPITDDNYKIIHRCVKAAIDHPFELMEDVDAIESPLVSSPHPSIFDLSGRPLREPQPGLQIIGGKKVFLRNPRGVRASSFQ